MLPKGLREKIVEPLINTLPDSHGSLFPEYARRAKKFISGVSEIQADRHFKWMQIFTEESKKGLLKSYSHTSQSHSLEMIKSLCGRFNGDPINRVLYTDVMFCLPYDMLTKVDSMSMLNSLEVRVPYLDQRVVELAFSMKGNLKLNGLKRKYVLVEAFKDILPPILHNRPKQGFDVPIGEWFKSELRDLFWSVVDDKSIKKHGLLNSDFIHKMYDSHCANRSDYSKQLLNIFIFQWWLKKNHPAL